MKPAFPTILAAFLLSTTIASANLITFRVHMGLQRDLGNFNPDNGDTVVVSGTFSSPDWTTTSTLSPFVGNTNVYMGTFSNDVPAGNFVNYKFVINPGGNSPANELIWESGNNRSLLISPGDQGMPIAFFNNLSPGTIIVTQVTFRVNLEAQTADGTFNPATDTVSVTSDILNSWSTNASPLTNSPLQPNMWRGTFGVSNVIGTNVNYKFIKHTQVGGDVVENNGVGPGGAQYRQFVLGNAFPLRPLVDFNNKPAPMDFMAGVDMSHLVFFEDRGVTYRVNGVEQDALTLLKDRGINCVRLRLFTSTAAQAEADAYNYTNNLSYNLPLAVRAKNAGLKLLLDFHYSDSWADPGKQFKPAAWTNLNFTQLKAQVRSYTSNTIAVLNAAGAMPDYVQIGNEMISGMLWNDGRVGGGFDTANQWSQLAQLLASGVQGVKDAGGQMPKIMVHIDRGADWGGTQWFFDHIEAEQVPFDVIGESYYGWWHGSPDALRSCLNNAANRYGRPIIVVETAFPWADSTNIFGIPATPAGQVQFVTQLAQIVKGVSGGKGVGIVWWATEYQEVNGEALAGFDRRSFFDSDGNVLPVADTFGLLTAPIALNPSLDGANLKLAWPLSGAAMQLICTTNLAPSTAWTSVTNTVQNTNGIFSVTVPPNNQPASFYRLRSN